MVSWQVRKFLLDIDPSEEFLDSSSKAVIKRYQLTLHDEEKNIPASRHM
jgi:hypothetical protein